VTQATTGDGYETVSDEDPTWGAAPISFPRIQGADVCGEIVAVGEGVNPARIGERVISDNWLRDPDDPTDMATFSCSYSTAEGMLTRANVTANDTVLVPGASGGVGGALVQLAKRRGARVIAMASTAKHEDVAKLGPDKMIERGPENLRNALGDEKITVVADVVGGEYGRTRLADILFTRPDLHRLNNHSPGSDPKSYQIYRGRRDQTRARRNLSSERPQRGTVRVYREKAHREHRCDAITKPQKSKNRHVAPNMSVFNKSNR